eukprot:Skav217051  [mRNA]  locus=scaffold1849:231066:235847:+ [translate_table: standard]
MVERPMGLRLDEPFDGFQLGASVHVLAFVQVVSPGETLCVTVGRGQPFLTNAPVDADKPTITILDGTFTKKNGNVWIEVHAHSKWFQHSHPTHRDFDIMVEGCAGIGAVNTGYNATGTTTVALIEQNIHFVEWLKSTGHTNVIHARMQDKEALVQVADILEGRGHVLTAGVACQPFSSMGDRREEMDERSVATPATLQMGYYNRATAIILECTKEARDSPWIQGLLQEFCKATNYNMKQTVLHLHHTVPAMRTRWWCILVHPAFPIRDIPDMPAHRFDPVMMQIIPRPLKLAPKPQVELELDDYEVATFGKTRGGLTKFVINMWHPMPTATHSWGSQLTGCPCQCRQYGFSSHRIEERGLHALVVPVDTPGSAQTGATVFRHISAQEVAAVHGLHPSYVNAPANEKAKLTLTGVGQMASPLQGAWVLGNMKYFASQVYANIQAENPRRTVANFCRSVLRECLALWETEPTVSMQIFAYEVEALDHPRIFPSEEDRDRAFATRILQVSGATTGSTMEPIGQQHPTLPCAESPRSIATTTPVGGLSGFESQGASDHSRSSSFNHSRTLHQVHEHARPDATDDHSRTHSSDHACDNATNTHDHSFILHLQSTMEDAHHADETRATSQESIDYELQTFFASQPNDLPHDHKRTHAEAFPEDMLATTDDYQLEPITEQATEHEVPSFWLVTAHESPVAIPMVAKTTVGKLCLAEAALLDQPVNEIKPLSVVGVTLPGAQCITPGQAIVFRAQDDVADDRCPCKCVAPPIPDMHNDVRGVTVWRQRGWVADDEMKYYLGQLATQQQIHTDGPLLLLDPEEAAEDFGQWFTTHTEQALAQADQHRVFTAVLMDHHWFPVELAFSSSGPQVFTTPDMESKVRTWVVKAGESTDVEVGTFVVDTQFPADCGFQTVNWIACRSLGQDTITSMSSQQAEDLRFAFIRHLQQDGQDQQCRHTHLGGAKQDSNLLSSLQELIVQHGVDEHRSQQCAQQLLQTIGQQQIRTILGSPRPWADLKQHANQHSLKIVTAAELKEAINKRLQAGLPFGRKDQKKKEKARPAPLRLHPEQIAIPDSVFQVEGQPVPQISPHQLQSVDRGMMVMTVEDALPFLQLSSPMQKVAVAIIVLDHQDERLPAQRNIIKFPANCVATGEAMLVTGAIFQVGQKKAERPTTCNKIRIEETELVVLRAQVYKDQTPLEWSTFCQHPVKTLLGEQEFAKHRDAIHDVWDRQFLSARFQKTKPAEADVFLVTLRMTKGAGEEILQHNAIEGKYYEPRMPNGRSPDEAYEVIWNPKKSLGEVQLMQQTNPHPAMIARTGGRYGLRVLRAHAPATHAKHRPDLAYIPSDNMQMFRIGPLPFNTTRASLTKVFREWAWPARPGQPVGQDQQHTGMFWTAMASQPPSHWVFHCEHGDILISRVPSKKDSQPSTAFASANVEASKLTLQHLKGQASGSTDTGADPWAKDDPWAQGIARTKQVSPHQLAVMEANIEKKVIAAIQPQIYRMDDDEDMVSSQHEQRVADLEHQVNAMKSNMEQLQQGVQQFQTQQTAQNQQVNAQLTGVQHQIEAQQRSYQNMLDQKLAQQLEHIDALLAKRAKFASERE